MRLYRQHYKVTTPHNCNCSICEKWQNAQQQLAIVKQFPTTDPTRMAAERTALVSELCVNLWSELSWYAAIEAWTDGWMKHAIMFLHCSERDWIMNLQYHTMEEWLDEFIEWQQ